MRIVIEFDDKGNISIDTGTTPVTLVAGAAVVLKLLAEEKLLDEIHKKPVPTEGAK